MMKGNKNFTNKFAADILENFKVPRLLGKHPYDDEFEKEWGKVKVPWYLKPFTKKIKEMHKASFYDRKFSGDGNETFTIKRPTDYKGG